MSRKNAKICKVHDLQSRYSDIILTKKDCDLICKALVETFIANKDRKDKLVIEATTLERYFKELTRI